MSLFDRLKAAASQLAEKGAEGADRLARYVAEKGPGFVGEGAAEMVAERDYHRAQELASAGLGPEVAQQVADILAPNRSVPGRHAVLIHRLLADAYLTLDRLDDAQAEYDEALRVIRDPLERRAAEEVLVEELNQVSDQLEAEILVSVGGLALQRGDAKRCLLLSDQAISMDRQAMTAYYLKGSAMLRLGYDEMKVGDVFLKAMGIGDKAQVVEWVRELLPGQLEWFQQLAG